MSASGKETLFTVHTSQQCQYTGDALTERGKQGLWVSMATLKIGRAAVCGNAASWFGRLLCTKLYHRVSLFFQSNA